MTVEAFSPAEASDVIREQARARHGSTPRASFAELPGVLLGRGSTPTCGDEIEVGVIVSEAGVIEHLHWDGRGCEVSQASASLLAGIAPGLDAGRLSELREALRASVREDVLPGEVDADALGDALALHGIGRYPLRGSCALLSWHALAEALGLDPVS